jgi:hypothetical protein
LLTVRFPASLIERRSTGETCPGLSWPERITRLQEAVPRKTLRDLRQARREPPSSAQSKKSTLTQLRLFKHL